MTPRRETRTVDAVTAAIDDDGTELGPGIDAHIEVVEIDDDSNERLIGRVFVEDTAEGERRAEQMIDALLELPEPDPGDRPRTKTLADLADFEERRKRRPERKERPGPDVKESSR